MAVYAYLRVSTQEQTIEGQQYEIRKWCGSRGVTVDTWIKESVSGTIPWEKRKLGRMIKRMRPDDLMICTEISRLGRNMLMIMSILNVCCAKGVKIHTIKDNFDLTDSINSKIIAFAFALASEIERNLISQRTKEALAAKKQSGVKLGRPSGQSKKLRRIMSEQEVIIGCLADGKSITSLAKRYGIHRNTMSKYIRAIKQNVSSADF